MVTESIRGMIELRLWTLTKEAGHGEEAAYRGAEQITQMNYKIRKA